MKRYILLTVFTAMLATGCGGDEKPTPKQSSVPPASDMFDKKDVPGEQPGPKSE